MMCTTPLLILSWKRFDFRKSKWFRFSNLDVISPSLCVDCLLVWEVRVVIWEGWMEKKMWRAHCVVESKWVAASASPENPQISLMSPHCVEETNPTREAESVQAGEFASRSWRKQRTHWGLEEWTPTSLWGDIPGESRLFLHHPTITATFPSH